MSYTTNKFAIRKVKNGKVKINGKYYIPENTHMDYDGRLEGKCFAFGLYNRYIFGRKYFISLWGTKEEFYSEDIEKVKDNPHLVDGGYPWLWWYEV